MHADTPPRTRGDAVHSATGAEDSAAVSASGVVRRYGRTTTALDGITVAIPTGHRVALVGPNGAGKTTLIRCWMGFDRPTAGSVRVLGEDPRRRRQEVGERVAFVPQQPALYRSFSVDQHLMLASHAREHFDRGGAEDYLERFHVRLKARVSTLSGGERAQVMIAIAASMHADVLLLDEPLASLDPLARRTALDVLTARARGGTSTMVLASHVIGDVAYGCDWLVLLARGKVLLSGEIGAVVRGFSVTDRPDRAAMAIGAVPRPEGRTSWLVPADERADTRAATLEDVVMGHLAGVTS